MQLTDEQVLRVCDVIRQTSFAVHQYLRSGYLEKVYERSLHHRLKKQGIQAVAQAPLSIFDEDGTPLGEYLADLLVEHCLIVELKACKELADEHLAQLFGCLRAGWMRHGLLINFGARELQIRKYVLD